jgi:hypothetical protein
MDDLQRDDLRGIASDVKIDRATTLATFAREMLRKPIWSKLRLLPKVVVAVRSIIGTGLHAAGFETCVRSRMDIDRYDQAEFVMPGLVPGIHVFTGLKQEKTWMAGTSPAMTNGGSCSRARAAKQPVGQITKFLSSPRAKNFPLFFLPKSHPYPRRPVPRWGRLAIVTNAGRDAVDAWRVGRGVGFLQGGLRSVSDPDKTLTTARKADGEVAWS